MMCGVILLKLLQLSRGISNHITILHQNTTQTKPNLDASQYTVNRISDLSSKGIFRFGKKEKLSPRFIGPFEILERVGVVAYRLALPPNLSFIHLVFHVSMLRKYLSDPSHVLEVQSVEIMDRQVRKLRSKDITSVKVKWKGHSCEEAIWELDDKLREEYPYLFDNLSKYSIISIKFRGRNFYKVRRLWCFEIKWVGKRQ